MAQTIPCPNPTCSHDFSLADVQSAAQLLCPKCGFKMQGKGDAAAKPAAAKPAAAKPAPVAPKPAPAPAIAKPPPAATPLQAKPIPPKPPVAAPVQAKPVVAPAKPVPAAAPPQAKPVPTPSAVPAAPLAAPVPTAPPSPAAAPAPASEQSVPEGMYFNPDIADAGPLVRTLGKPQRKFNWMKLALVALAVGFAICLVIIGGYVVFTMVPRFRQLYDLESGDTFIGKIRNSKNETEKVYKLVLSRREWTVDAEIKGRFDAHAAWKSNDYDFWFALNVQDFGAQKPREAEMLRICIEKLEAHFGEDLELAAKAEPIKFGDLDGQKLQFRGTVKEARWLGECYILFKNGVGYWLFAASPKDDVIAYFADELPTKHFFVVSERRGWTEQPVPVITYTSTDNKIEVTAPKGVWEKGTPKDEDENGILLLSGRFVREKDNRKNALLIVFTLKKEDDLKAALTAAREHLDAKEKAVNTMYKVVHAPEITAGQTEAGTVDNVGNKRGRIVDLKLLFGDETQRYFLLSVINEPDATYGVLAECDWKSRQIWRQDFLDVLRTLRVK